MEVFHYVANELKDTPLFDNRPEPARDTGSIYNDFDLSSVSLMVTSEECAEFSFSQKVATSPEKNSATIAEAVDYAVMDADVSDGLLYEHLVWDSPLFDNYSETCDDSYIEKVHKLVMDVDGCWSEITVSPQAEAMFRRRFRTNWEAPDSVYDAWVIRQGWERGWFDTHRYNVMYPETLDVAAATQSPPQKRTKKIVPPTSTSSSEEEQPEDRQSTPAKGSRRTRPPRLVSSSDSTDYSPVETSEEEDESAEKKDKEHVTGNATEGGGGEKEHVEIEEKVSDGAGGGEKEHVEDEEKVIDGGGGGEKEHVDDEEKVIDGGGGGEKDHVENEEKVSEGAGGGEKEHVEDEEKVIDGGGGGEKEHVENEEKVSEGVGGGEKEHVEEQKPIEMSPQKLEDLFPLTQKDPEKTNDTTSSDDDADETNIKFVVERS